MRWVLITFMIVLFAALAFFPFQKVNDDGLWPLSVTVRSERGQAIRGFSAEAFLDVQSAQAMLADPPPVAFTRAENSMYAAVQEPKTDKPLVVNVPTSETSHGALLWTYRRFFQYRGLLVVVEYENGKRDARAIAIPDMRLRNDRHVTIEVP